MANYTIKSGDTLSQLALNYGTNTAGLMKLNPNLSNPDLIKVGGTINIPTNAPAVNNQAMAPVINNQNQNSNTPPIYPIINAATAGPASSYPSYVPPSTGTPTITWNFLNGANSALNQAQNQQNQTQNQMNGAEANVQQQAQTLAQQQAQTLAQQQQTAQSNMNAALTKTKTDIENKQASTQAEQDNTLSNLNTLTQPFRESYENAQRDSLSINKNFQDNQNLVDELQTLLTQGNDLIQQQKGVTGLSSIRNPRIQQSIDTVNARVGVIQAVMAARNGQIAQAETLIDRGLNAITADRQDRISYYNTLLGLSNNKLLDLNSQHKDIVNAELGQLQSAVDSSQKSADYIKSLMINPETASYMANAGVNLNDSVDEINGKLSKYGNQKEIDEMANKYITEGYIQSPIATNRTIEVEVGGKTLHLIPPAGVLLQQGGKTGTETAVAAPIDLDAPMGIKEITKFKATYGWAAPIGASWNEALSYRGTKQYDMPVKDLEGDANQYYQDNGNLKPLPPAPEASGFWDTIKDWFWKH